jgi:transposase
MKALYAGLDVSYETTSICVIDSAGSVALETATATSPDAIVAALKPYRRRLKLVGQESGNLAAWLQKTMVEAKLPMVCLDARHASSALSAKINKTDTNDARGLATLLARGIYVTAHIKSDEASRLQSLLVVRDALLRRTRDLQRTLNMTQRKFPEAPSKRRRAISSDIDQAFALALANINQTIEGLDRDCEGLTQLATKLAKESPVCSRLMSVPGVGPFTALNFVAAVDDPNRFKASRDVAAYFGLTPRQHQSGSTTRSGRISRMGNSTARRALYNAANSLLVRSSSDCALRRWGLRIARAKGHKVACVACARKLAVIMHRLWISGESFDESR